MPLLGLVFLSPWAMILLVNYLSPRAPEALPRDKQTTAWLTGGCILALLIGIAIVVFVVRIYG